MSRPRNPYRGPVVALLIGALCWVAFIYWIYTVVAR